MVIIDCILFFNVNFKVRLITVDLLTQRRSSLADWTHEHIEGVCLQEANKHQLFSTFFAKRVTAFDSYRLSSSFETLVAI